MYELQPIFGKICGILQNFIRFLDICKVFTYEQFSSNHHHHDNDLSEGHHHYYKKKKSTRGKKTQHAYYNIIGVVCLTIMMWVHAWMIKTTQKISTSKGSCSWRSWWGFIHLQCILFFDLIWIETMEELDFDQNVTHFGSF